MNESARELVDRLVAAGPWPDPDLLEAILDQGEEAVGPLLGVLGNVTDLDLTGFVSELLISLRDPEALPPLLELLRKGDLDLLDILDDRLGEFGSIAIDPLLEIARDPGLDAYTRSAAVSSAVRAAGDDAVYRSRIATTLNEILADLLAHADDAESRPDDPDGELISFLVSDLSHLADPRSRALIDSAFDKDLVDLYIIDRADVDNAFAKGGEWSRPAVGPKQWLSKYREQYKYHLEGPVRRAPSRDSDPFEMTLGDLDPSPPVETIRNSGARPGRNDPCWCGSGKKYKKCHRETDHAG